jgi:hypothetical protein
VSRSQLVDKRVPANKLDSEGKVSVLEEKADEMMLLLSLET